MTEEQKTEQQGGAAERGPAPDSHLQEIIAPLHPNDVVLLMQVCWVTIPESTRAKALIEVTGDDERDKLITLLGGTSAATVNDEAAGAPTGAPRKPIEQEKGLKFEHLHGGGVNMPGADADGNVVTG